MTAPRAERRRLALATPHAIATTAGVEAFQRGGNALDAALAAAASLTVALPDNCSPGGDLIAIVRRPDGQVVVVNASGPAAAAIDVDAVRERHGNEMPAFTADTVTVPGLLDGWETIWRLGAERPWAEVFSAAIEQARSGVPVAQSVATALERYSDRLRSDPGMARVFFGSGRALAVGETLVQRELASTLEHVAEAGARAFYEGPVGATWLTSMTAEGSALSVDDLVGFGSEVTDPLVAADGGREILVAPPNSQGALLLKTLAILDSWDLDPLSRDAPMFAAAFQVASDARKRYLADPRVAEVQLDLLVRKTNHADEPPAGTVRNGSGDTVALVAADSEGWAVSLIQSLFDSFGCGVLDPHTGIIAHNRGSFFSLDPSSPNVLAPGKRPAHTLSPVLVHEGGQLRNVLGTMGGLAQTQILTHVLMHLRRGGNVAEAVSAPRWTLGALEAHGDRAVIQAEANVAGDAVDALRAGGWSINTIPARSLDVGDAAAISRDGDGTLSAAADPRGPGSAVVE
jgi:gamma-glutamyltranspeptidase/glutathione hydrolase